MQTWSQPAIPLSNGRSSFQSRYLFSHSRRGGRVGKPTPPYSHRNRSLVLHNSASAKIALGGDRVAPPDSMVMNTTATRSSENLAAQAVTGWISKRDRHMQLINSSIYDRETNVRSKAIDQTRRQVANRRDERERFKIHKHLQRIANTAAATPFPPRPNSRVEPYELGINGLSFRVCDGGSKLIRIMSKYHLYLPWS